MSETVKVPVLIVGGSVVGLSAALFLGWHGVPALLVERHATTSIHPRAGGFHTRTMELFRQVGLEAAIFAQETPPERLGEMGLRVESLAGKVLDSTEAAAHQQANFSNPFPSPTRTAMIGQDKLEPLLRARASELGCDIRFGTELVECEPQADGVRALIRERTTGQEYTLEAQYVIAADGHRSLLRQQLGIDSYGYGRLGQWVSILFRTDLSKLLGKRKISLCFINNATVDGILGQNEERWALFAHVSGEQDTLSPTRYLELVRAALGLPDQPVEIISALPWELASRVAERYQAGRIFLAGDAAHVMTTMGAFGANTGIADAHNLAWKLALVLKNQATPDLLTTYGQERQPAADLAVGVSTGLYVYRLAHLEQREAILESANKLLARVRPHAPERQPTAFSVMQGYRYCSAAILSRDEDDDGALFENEPSARPGTRAPHIWLTCNARPMSILDLYGQHFVLLTGPEGQPWQTQFERFRQSGFPLDIYTIGPGLPCCDDNDDFLTTYGLDASGAVLVRPDGFVAWRAQHALPAEQNILPRLLGREHP